MNGSEERLAQALRELAATSPREAPAELGLRLESAFRRHHSRRRRQRILLAAGMMVCVAVSVAWLLAGKRPRTELLSTRTPARPSRLHERETQPAPAISKRGPVSSLTGQTGAIAHRVFPHRARAAAKPSGNRLPPAITVAADDFVALPSLDPALPVGPLRMVRLKLPGSALQLLGYPINHELLDRSVLTDVLVGQDDVPYAVRFVQLQAIPEER